MINSDFMVTRGPDGSMSQVVGLPNDSYKLTTNSIRLWFAPGFVKYKKGALDQQLLTHGRCFSSCTPASSTSKTGRNDIAEILLKVAFKHQKSVNQSLFIEGYSQLITNIPWDPLYIGGENICTFPLPLNICSSSSGPKSPISLCRMSVRGVLGKISRARVVDCGCPQDFNCYKVHNV